MFWWFKILKQLSKRLPKFHIIPWRGDLWRHIFFIINCLVPVWEAHNKRKYIKAVLCYKIRVLHFNLYFYKFWTHIGKVFMKFQGRIWFRIELLNKTLNNDRYIELTYFRPGQFYHITCIFILIFGRVR